MQNWASIPLAYGVDAFTAKLYAPPLRGASMTDEVNVEEQVPGVTYIGVPADAPTTYADNCAFVTSVGPTARLQFVEFVPGASDSTAPGMKVRYVRTIVMPIDGFRGMVTYFNGVIAKDTPEEKSDGE